MLYHLWLSVMVYHYYMVYDSDGLAVSKIIERIVKVL